MGRNPRKELQSDTTDHLLKDSSLDICNQPGHDPSSQSHAYGGGQERSHQHRFASNLYRSNGNTIGLDAEDVRSGGGYPQQAEASRAPAQSRGGPCTPDEDPDNVHRRRTEKNFSDLFGAKSGEYRSVRGQREEVTGSKTCSFLDTRAEIAKRNKEHWGVDHEQQAADRKVLERSSGLFDRSCPEKPEMEPEYKEVYDAE